MVDLWKEKLEERAEDNYEQALPVAHVIKGACFGVVILKDPGSYQQKDEHLANSYQFELIVEDDGNWHLGCSGGSITWIPEIIDLLKEAEKWTRSNPNPRIKEVQLS